MTRIADLLAAGPTYSIEFPPPKTDTMLRQFEKTVAELRPLHPSFCSVTYGAGGSTKAGTLEAVLHIHQLGQVVMPHLTCAGQSRAELVDLIERYRADGLENILALAGDPPKDGSSVGDFNYAVELIDLVRSIGDFCVVVAAFPEVHPRSVDRASDRRWLAAKLEVADAAITQFFWDADHYLRLRDELDQLGVTTPVIPSLFPILSAQTARLFSSMNGSEWPAWLDARLDAAGDDDAEAVRRVGVEVATELGQRLLAEDIPGLHLYSLNRSESVLDIWDNLGLPRA